MEDINKTLKNIKDTRRRITKDIERLSAEDINNDAPSAVFDTGEPDGRSVWAVSFISKQREIDILKAQMLKKEHEAHELALKLKTLEHRLSTDQSIWENKIKLKEEENKVRLLTLENQNQFLRDDNSIVKEGLHRQLEDLREQKRAVEQDLLELRNKYSHLEKDYYKLKSDFAELKNQNENFQKYPDTQGGGSASDLKELNSLRKQLDELKAREEEYKASILDKEQIVGGVFSSEVQHSLEVLREREKNRFLELEDFARGYAHKFRNLLGVVSGTAQLALCDEKLNKDLKEQFQLIDENCQMLLTVVEQLLAFTKIPELQYERCSINEILDNVSSALSDKAKPLNITIKKSFASELPDVSVDKKIISETFEAVINNSIDSLPQGGEIRISTGMDSVRGMIEIRFEDNGVGISENHLKKVFQPYFTSKKERKGLGLTLARRTVDLHFGMMSAESIKDKGTTLIILLPKA